MCFRNLDDPSKYMSSEWAFILIDELTKHPYTVFTELRTRLRWPGVPDVECQFAGGTNPGGVGHGWVKQFWIDKNFPKEWLDPIDYRPQFSFVPSKATDNPHLKPEYYHSLNTLPESIRAAYRDGSWNVFIGQAFPEVSRERMAISPVWPLPPYAPLYMTYDWGYGRPFSLGWWWIDEEGRAIRFASWYGAAGPNQGLRMTDSEVACGIIDREVKWGLASMPTPGDYASVVWNRAPIRYSGFDCFNKKPDYKGGGQGPTTAETFTKFGVHLTAMDSSRHVKIRQFREYLQVPEGDEWPRMLVYATDDDFFRVMPDLVMDKLDPEDVDSSAEDHIYDEVCHICMARPISMEPPQPPKTGPQRIIEVVESGMQDDSGGLPVGLYEDDGEGELFDEGVW